MNVSYKVRLLMLCMIGLLLIGAIGPSSIKAAPMSSEELRALEEQGIDPAIPADFNPADPGEEIIPLDSLPDYDVLLIPNSTNKSVGMYDPFSGDFLGLFVVDDTANLSTPICAIPGPDGNIYVSDQIDDAVRVYDKQGNFVMTYADNSDGLDNIRGISFRDGHLFVTSNALGIFEFSGPHTLVGMFITDSNSNWDIYFLPDGRSIVSNSTGTDDIRRYSATGVLELNLFNTSFPEQVQLDLLDNDSYLAVAFTSNLIYDFDIEGNVSQTTSLSGGRGIYRLGNGNYLGTNGSGVHEITPGGGIIRTVNTGSARFIELYTFTPQGDASEIDLSPTSFTETVAEGGIVNLNLFVSNLGTAELVYGVSDDQAWITCVPDTGVVPVSEADTVVVTLDATSLTPGNYTGQIIVTSNDPDEGSTMLPVSLEVTGGGGGCDYLPGDINGNGTTNGIDVTYGVIYFKGGTAPPIDCGGICPQASPFYAAGDVNGNCVFNGIDITFFVNYLKGIVPSLLHCPDCPPAP